MNSILAVKSAETGLNVFYRLDLSMRNASVNRLEVSIIPIRIRWIAVLFGVLVDLIVQFRLKLSTMRKN